MEKFSRVMQEKLKQYSPKRQASAMKLALIILEDSSVTITEMTRRSGYGARTVQWYLKEFQDAGVLIRKGSDISGKWILL